MKQEILDIISKHLGLPVEEINMEDDLFADLNASQMAITDILLELEEKYKVEPNLEEKEKIQTVEDLIELFSTSYDLD